MLDGFGDVPLCVELDIDSYDGPWPEIARFRDASGWVQVSEIKLFAGEEVHATTVVAACDEYGAPHEDWYAPRLLRMAVSNPQPCHFDFPGTLGALRGQLAKAFERQCARDGNKALQAVDELCAGQIARIEALTDQHLRAADVQIAELRRRRRMLAHTPDERSTLDAVIAEIEEDQRRTLDWQDEQRGVQRAWAEGQERRLMRRFRPRREIEILYTLHWHARPLRRYFTWDWTEIGHDIGDHVPDTRWI